MKAEDELSEPKRTLDYNEYDDEDEFNMKYEDW